jgi:hypothetical protein
MKTLPRFPVSLRKMWSGREVQEWIDQNIVTSVELTDQQVISYLEPIADKNRVTREEVLYVGRLLIAALNNGDS